MVYWFPEGDTILHQAETARLSLFPYCFTCVVYLTDVGNKTGKGAGHVVKGCPRPRRAFDVRGGETLEPKGPRLLRRAAPRPASLAPRGAIKQPPARNEPLQVVVYAERLMTSFSCPLPRYLVPCSCLPGTPLVCEEGKKKWRAGSTTLTR